MELIRKYFSNARRPAGRMGHMMVAFMNSGHAKMSQWGRAQLPPIRPSLMADLGCGGGRNAAELLKQFPEARLTALDYSEVSVSRTETLNRAAVKQGRCRVLQGDVSDLPLKTEAYDLATAFETVYFWPGPLESFREVYRILKPGGRFLIVNETDGTNEKDDKWAEMIDGMRIFSADELCGLLKEAGFARVEVSRKPENFWISFCAEKV